MATLKISNAHAASVINALMAQAKALETQAMEAHALAANPQTPESKRVQAQGLANANHTHANALRVYAMDLRAAVAVGA